jgi:hypothetical protein
MARPRKRDRLSESINVPVRRQFKQRVIELAEKSGERNHTAFARNLLERAVNELEGHKPLVASK